MSKEQLKLVKDIRNYIDGQGEYDEEVEALDWLIKEAELTQDFAKKNTELNVFLNDYATAKDWGKNVIDVAMRIIKVQAEQVDGLKNKAKKLKEEKQKFMLSATKQRKQKQLYREGLYRLTRNLEGRVDYILRDEINDFVEVLERESE